MPQCVDCKRVYCRLCTKQMKACVVCDRPVCASSLNRCPTRGRGTCREHVGLCHAAEGEPALILPVLSPLTLLRINSAEVLRPPRIAKCTAHFECRVEWHK